MAIASRLKAIEKVLQEMDGGIGRCSTCGHHDCWNNKKAWGSCKVCTSEPFFILACSIEGLHPEGEECFGGGHIACTPEYKRQDAIDRAKPRCQECGWHISEMDIEFDIDAASGKEVEREPELA